MGKYNRKFDTVGWNKGNPYYDPKQCGLSILGTAEKEPDWDFSILVAFRDLATNAVFLAYDSGCSCPTPFEEFDGLDKMQRIKKIEDFDRHVKNLHLYEIPERAIRNLRGRVNRQLNDNIRREAKNAAVPA